MRTLFVTSFSYDLYEASGKRLLESFEQIHLPAFPNDWIMVCYDNMPQGRQFLPSNSVAEPLDNNRTLSWWLRNNADIVPDYLGGQARRCGCPNTDKRHAKHKYGCHWQWMNRNASRFFRKVVSLDAANRSPFSNKPGPRSGFDFLVWLDADAYFKAPLPPKYLTKKLKKAAMFYFRGHRPAVESGILGFSFKNRGDEIIDAWLDRYTTGLFRRDERWDDGFQLARVVESTRLATVDLVHPTKWKTGPNRTNNVIPTTDIAQYLIHEKGRHGEGLDVMK